MIPRTLVSLLFHGTIPRYRDEIHLNIDQSFERFAINDKGFARFSHAKLPDVESVRAACKAVEIAAFKVRRRHSDGPDELRTTSATLFGYLAPLLAAELTSASREPDQAGKADPAEHFLANLYYLIYSPDVRKYDQTADQVLSRMESASPAVKASWDFVLRTPRGRTGDFQAFYEHTRTLCQALALEFVLPAIFTDIW